MRRLNFLFYCNAIFTIGRYLHDSKNISKLCTRGSCSKSVLITADTYFTCHLGYIFTREMVSLSSNLQILNLATKESGRCKRMRNRELS